MAEEYEVRKRIAAPSHRYCIRHWCPVWPEWPEWPEWPDKFAPVVIPLYNNVHLDVQARAEVEAEGAGDGEPVGLSEGRRRAGVGLPAGLPDVPWRVQHADLPGDDGAVAGLRDTLLPKLLSGEFKLEVEHV